MRTSFLAIALVAALLGAPAAWVFDAPAAMAQEALPAEAQEFLGDGRSAADLDQGALDGRIATARKLLGIKGLPGGARREIANRMREAIAERRNRKAAQKPAQAPEEQPAVKPAKKKPAVEDTAEQGGEPAAKPEKKKPVAPETAAGDGDAAKFLKDRRPAADLTDEELARRIARSRALLGSQTLKGDARGRVSRLLKEARAEQAKRGQAGNQKPAEPPVAGQPAEKPAEQAQTDVAGVREFLADTRPSAQLSAAELKARMAQALPLIRDKRVAAKQRRQIVTTYRADKAQLAQAGTAPPKEEPPKTTADAGAAAKFLADKRLSSELSGDDLKARIAAARPLIRDEGLPRNVRAAVRRTWDGDRAELEKRIAAKPGDQPRGGSSEGASKYLADKRPASELSGDGLKARIAQGRDLAKDKALPGGTRRAVLVMWKADRAELDRRVAQAEPGKGTDQKDVAELDKNKVDPRLEAKARQYLEDSRDVSKLDGRAFRRRLNDMRDVLQTNKLSPGTERAVRRKLADERRILRARIDRRDGRPGKGDTNVTNNIVNINIILGDRRPPEELDEYELARRIEVYRDYAYDEDYDEDDRLYWRRALDDDRRFLNRRLRLERERREAEYRRGGSSLEIGIDVELDLDSDARERGYVWAAEAEDEEIEAVLVAKPRRPVERRYTIEEIEEAPEAREAMTAIEIDTVRFGFNEFQLREEEVEKLDKIAETIEKIVAAHPGEVFLIEGHTDAVGSDTYNLDLSRKRAAAVKEALVTYYVIPEKNLETAGLGERYLKIPTAEAEEENRRVSLRRVTPLVGEAS